MKKMPTGNPRVFVSTAPFAEGNEFPLEMLRANGIDFNVNTLKRKLTEIELMEMAGDAEAIIAGTEPITRRVMEKCTRLRHISRVGVGLDSVNLLEAKTKGISVSYTPDAPAPAVAELTIGLMLSLLRNIHVANSAMHQGKWNRYFGRRIAEVTIGIIGVGRIGARVLRRTQGFGTPRLLVNDVLPTLELNREFKLEWVSKDIIFKQADLISLHVPLTLKTKDLVGVKELGMMKPDAFLINTSRGGVVNEKALYHALKENKIAGAAIDVFEKEPYQGPLAELGNCLLTSHMGSMSLDCRTRMEIEATEEAIRFLLGKPLLSPVPKEEYDLQREFGSSSES
jgi:D-3-phosphoglycerate dehydrogenase / 2-oxoglutarate reductase